MRELKRIAKRKGALLARLEKLDQFQAVEVKWTDAHSINSCQSWYEHDDIEDSPVIHITQIGYYYGIQAECLVLVSAYCPLQPTYMQPFRIPLGCVLSLKTMR